MGHLTGSTHRMFPGKNQTIWLYPATLVGLARLTLVVGAVTAHLLLPDRFSEWSVVLVVALLSLSRLLDLADGYLARRFNQTTAFGSLLDLALDLISHTTVWLLSGFFLAPLLIVLEWTTGLFVAALVLQPAGHWKTKLTTSGPPLIRAYFRQQQRNLLSAYGNIAHFVFPTALYLHLPSGWLWVALPGLLLYEGVTFWMLIALLRYVTRIKTDDGASG